MAKAWTKLERPRTAVQKQRKLIGDAVYMEKVALATQEAEKKKLADLESEANGFEATIEQLEQLKIE
ncbi:hypothetical protein ColLi_13384 [Colletotrichum liriopes]|uniref:Uncharacterized protein n=1 Tax=Colletotrichum liriopes TaxID=708192 RepID=A0AA37H237_9PEZI|nr:hypothetical protein ColLi_13384 [Colletotrichum liriopes]